MCPGRPGGGFPRLSIASALGLALVSCGRIGYFAVSPAVDGGEPARDDRSSGAQEGPPAPDGVATDARGLLDQSADPGSAGPRVDAADSAISPAGPDAGADPSERPGDPVPAETATARRCNISGKACSGDLDCRAGVCQSRASLSCQNDVDCPIAGGTCSGTSAPCQTTADCGAAVAGTCSYSGAACSSANPCPARLCEQSQSACNVDADCGPRRCADNVTTCTTNADCAGKRVVPTSGLVGWWKFDEPSGNMAIDSSGLGNTGLINFGTQGGMRGAGAYGGAILFRPRASAFSANDHTWVDVPTSTSIGLTRAFSIAAWARANVIKPEMKILDKKDQYKLAINNNPPSFLLFQFLYDSRTKWSYLNASASATPATGVWVHYVGTFDGQRSRGYENGVNTLAQFYGDPHPGAALVDNAWDLGGPKAMTASAFNLRIGGATGTAGNEHFWDGWLDEVMIWNRALSPSEAAGVGEGCRANRCLPRPNTCSASANVCQSGTPGICTGKNPADTCRL